MSDLPSRRSWQRHTGEALVLLLAVALGAHVAASLLAPLVPGLVIGLVLLSLFWFVLRRR